MLPCALHFTYVLHLFLYYLHFNHFTKSSFLLPPVIWYFSFLLLHNKLPEAKTMHIYCITISVGQKSTHGLAGSYAQGLRRRQSRCQVGCIHTYKLDWGKVCSQDNSDCFQNSLPYCCMRAQLFGWLSAGSYPHVLWDTFSCWRSLSPSGGNPQFPALWISQQGLWIYQAS